MQLDFDAAESNYRDVLRTDTARNHRIEAITTLANIAWRVRNDTSVAIRILRQDVSLSSSPLVLVEESRMLREQGNFARAEQIARDAMKQGGEQAERSAALTAFGEAVLGQYRRAARMGPIGESSRDSVLLTLSRELRDYVAAHPGRLLPAKQLLEAGALTGNGADMLAGWRSYFLVAVGDTISGLLAQPRRVISSAHSENSAIVSALITSRMFEAALLVAARAPATATSSDLRSYLSFADDIKKVTDDYYRSVALGDASKRKWKSTLDDVVANHWSHFTWASGKAPSFESDKLLRELDRRYGTRITTGETAGTDDLHYGHRVVDETRTVSQYGKTAKVRFVALDAMISNGYQSWGWNGRAQHGGWGGASEITQVRPPYAEGPLRAWQLVTDSAEIIKLNRRIAEDSVHDFQQGITQPVAAFVSIGERMERDERKHLIDSLSSAGVKGAALEAAFEKLMGDAEIESAIFAHEGRHAIDEANGIKGSTADREFRAKLSQVAFAPRPRMSISTIMDVTLGDKTPHGQADLRFAKGIFGWLQANASSVKGLNSSAPLLPQLPLLSNDQLRLAARSLDPLATAAR